jgi:hypothetical protein
VIHCYGQAVQEFVLLAKLGITYSIYRLSQGALINWLSIGVDMHLVYMSNYTPLKRKAELVSFVHAKREN